VPYYSTNPKITGEGRLFLSRGSRGSRGRKELNFLTINPPKLAWWTTTHDK